MELKLGMQVEDKITGFKGTLTAKAEYITGCTQYLVSPRVDKDGKHVDGRWIDDERLGEPAKTSRPGGPQSEAPPTS